MHLLVEPRSPDRVPPARTLQTKGVGKAASKTQPLHPKTIVSPIIRMVPQRRPDALSVRRAMRKCSSLLHRCAPLLRTSIADRAGGAARGVGPSAQRRRCGMRGDCGAAVVGTVRRPDAVERSWQAVAKRDEACVGGTVRDACWDTHVFTSLTEACVRLGACRQHHRRLRSGRRSALRECRSRPNQRRATLSAADRGRRARRSIPGSGRRGRCGARTPRSC